MTLVNECSREQLEQAAAWFDKAHDLLLENGWAGSVSRGGVAPMCIETALGRAVTGSTLYSYTKYLVINASGDNAVMVVPKWFVDLARHEFGMDAHWNDNLTTTVDAVYDKLRYGAKACREEAGAR